MNIYELLNRIHKLERYPNENAQQIRKYRNMLREWERKLRNHTSDYSNRNIPKAAIKRNTEV